MPEKPEKPEPDQPQVSAEETEDFAELLEAQESLSKPASGGVIWGRFIAKEGENYLFDIGRKSEGAVPAQDLPNGLDLSSGALLPVVIAGRAGEGRTGLSVRRAMRYLQRRNLKKRAERGEALQARILRPRSDGFFLTLRFGPSEPEEAPPSSPEKLWEFFPYPAFLPMLEVDPGDPRPLNRWPGKTVTVKLLEVPEGEPAVVSRKRHVEETREQTRARVLAGVKAGDRIEAEVAKIAETQVELDYQGVACLLSQVESSWYPKPNLARQLRRGETLTVRVLKVDPEAKKLTVSRRALLAHPANEIAAKFKPGAVVEGTVSRKLVKGGCFVRLPDLKRDAFIPRAEIPEDSEITEGASLKATVMKVDKEMVRLILSCKRYERSQEPKLLAKYLAENQSYRLGDLLAPAEEEEPPPEEEAPPE